MKYLCTNPQLGARLPHYIANLLDDAESEKLEAHLNDCRHCKDHYLTILRGTPHHEAYEGIGARVEAMVSAHSEDDDSSAGSSSEEATDVPPALAQRKASNGS